MPGGFCGSENFRSCHKTNGYQPLPGLPVNMSGPSGSPPPSWYKYPPQGSAVGPPPMPNKPNRSPERDRRSPGYDREAEWRRFQEWEKRNNKSPQRASPQRSPPRMQNRPPSPRRERSPMKGPPQEWARRSPPRNYRPPEWGRRSRSPPQPQPWGRRSPPRYAPPPRGRSPPRSRHRSPPRWGPPPAEWERFRNHPGRRSPPRWGPGPHWDARRERYPAPHPEFGKWPPRPVDKHPPMQNQRPNGSAPPGVAPPPAKIDANKGTPEPLKSDDGSAEDEVLENYDLPDYDPEAPIGQKYVIAVSGFFCKICHKFYNSESSAKITHCKSKAHYEKFSKWVVDKKEEAVTQKRAASVVAAPATLAPAPVPPVQAPPVAPSNEKEEEKVEEPPAKLAKLEPEELTTAVEAAGQEEFSGALVIKEEVHEDSDVEANDSKYDPSEPTAEDSITAEIKEEDTEPSASEALSDTDKAHDGDFFDATLYNFRKMRVHQLKENLKRRGLPLHGLKPLLLKRLEKALLAEASEAAAAENTQQNEHEERQENEEVEEPKLEILPEEAGVDPATELTMTMHESDIEISNRKTQWITERELERELLQLEGTEKVLDMAREETKMGKKTVVQWTIRVQFRGAFPQDGLNFWMESHQQLPYRATLEE